MRNGENGVGFERTKSGGKFRPQTRHEDGASSDNRKCQCLFLKRVSSGIIWCMEVFFYKLGKLVATHPLKTIALSLLVCSGLGVGLIKFKEETDYENVWLPRDSRMLEETRWVKNTFPENSRYRYTQMIFEAENVLASSAVEAISAIYNKGTGMQLADGKNFTNICIKAGRICRINSFLELWSYNDTEIRSLTTDGIIDTISNASKTSPLYGTEIDVENTFGAIEKNENGKIIRAEAASMLWILKRDSETEKYAREWELAMVNAAKRGDKRLKNIFIFTARTYADEGQGAINEDLILLFIGFAIVLLYVIIAIGKFNMLEQKVLLSFAGLSTVGLSILFSYGFGFAVGILYTEMNQIAPFLLLGIGVDDMFVILEALKVIKEGEDRSGLKLPVEERVALSLKRAGVSITVTSVTDIVAFGIGGSTVIPSLSAFCIYTAIGVFALYVLQATFFVAFLTLDQRRVESGRDACVPCFKHKDYTPNKCSQIYILASIMKNYYGPVLVKWPVKIIVLLVTFAFTGVNIWSFTKLKTEFDVVLYLPKDSYGRDYLLASRKYFPEDGIFASVYCDEMDYTRNCESLVKMYNDLKQDPNIQSATVSFWMIGYRDWLNATHGATTNLTNAGFPSNDTEYYELLHQYVHSSGQIYSRYLIFKDSVSPSTVKASSFTYRHVKAGSTDEENKIIDSARKIVDGIKLDGGRCFAYSPSQYMWSETNRVLQPELNRNLALAAACVFVVTLFLITNPWTTIVVFTCIVFTVIDVAGTLQFWGVSIDTAASVMLILCFGLAVDYSAHIGHTFMVVKGTKNERAITTLAEIGPAVFNGGLTTFLAFCLLVSSNSYAFELFFKTFTSVVLFGLYHGLVYLPAILSVIGPAPYDTQPIGSEKAISSAQKVDFSRDETYEQPYQKKIYSLQNGNLHHSINGQIPEYWKHHLNGPIYERTTEGQMIFIPAPDYSPQPQRRY